MDLANVLLRTTARAFYGTEHILIVDALARHSTLTDADLAHILGMQPKALRRLCGKLKEDGMISVHSRGEKREGAPPSYFGHSSGASGSQPKERLFYRDWYYLNYHRAIDSLKYRLYKLNRHIESLGAPTTEKKDLICPRCKSTYTELEVMDSISAAGAFLCHRCGHDLDAADDADGANGPSENESMKRMNDQFSVIVGLMRQIDEANVPENDFDTALSHALPINRTDAHPGSKAQPVDVKPILASAKGLAMAPERVSVSVLEDGAAAETDPSEAQKRERDAKQNLLPEWISKSTISGEITAVGAREDAQRREREAHGGGAVAKLEEELREDKKKKDVTDNAVMDEYWKELQAEQERERREVAEEDDDEDDEDDDDDFEDVPVGAPAAPATPAVSLSNGATATAATTKTNSTGTVSSNATDDEPAHVRPTKIPRLDAAPVKVPIVVTSDSNGKPVVAKEAAAKDDVSDEDEEFEFEDV